jgi:hypothetical protein
MTSTFSTQTTAAPAGAPTTTTTRTRMLLTGGVVAGPLFVAVGLAQAFTRAGFDPVRHPLSLLSLGDFGWIQITNFVTAGLLFLGAAVGVRRVLHGGRAGTWGPLLLGAFGAPLSPGASSSPTLGWASRPERRRPPSMTSASRS